MTSGETEDRVQAVAAKQVEWSSLPRTEKAAILQEMVDILSSLSMDKVIELLGNAEADRMGFTVDSTEGQYEATNAAFTYVAIVHGAVTKLLAAYKGDKKPDLRAVQKNGQTVIQTLPILTEDKFGPLGKSQAEVWLKPGTDDFQSMQLDAFLNRADKKGCMVVLGAGNHCFLSTVDCLHGLFQCNMVVYMKHHPVRNHHDALLRRIMKPLIDRGYFDCELDTGNIARTKEIVYHDSVSRVHLTGGKATHDAIVWGGGEQRKKPILKAEMTSELGCVTPWILAPQVWTEKQLDHQVKNLFGSMFSNAGANCNSPKVVIMTKDWEHAGPFVQKLTAEMAENPLPVAYYPGSTDRWNNFRKAYPDAKEFGDSSQEAARARQLQSSATVLPWLVIDGIQVDLTTAEGRKKAANEYAFRNEPFCPVVTIAYIDDLKTAVTLSNNYLYGSLSCTLVAPENTPEIEQAIADLKYGGIAVNAWSAFCYMATGCTWGAFPGESLDNVESGIGQIHNCFFIPGIEKSVLRTPMIDPVHVMRMKNLVAARKKLKATGNFILQPGVYGFVNLIVATAMGVELPPPWACASVAAAAAGLVLHRVWMVKDRS